MYKYDDEVLQAFLEMQSQLFDEEVAADLAEARAFLEDCMAAVCKNLKEVREYFDDSGADISELSDSELKEAAEVFVLPDGRYLVVEA